jgi:hypothetical protein
VACGPAAATERKPRGRLATSEAGIRSNRCTFLATEYSFERIFGSASQGVSIGTEIPDDMAVGSVLDARLLAWTDRYASLAMESSGLCCGLWPYQTRYSTR